MTPAILLVTWSLYNQPARNSQSQFASMEACQDARTKLLQVCLKLSLAACGGKKAPDLAEHTALVRLPARKWSCPCALQQIVRP